MKANSMIAKVTRYANVKNALKALTVAAGLLWAGGAMAGAVVNAKIVSVMGGGGASNAFFVYVDTAATTAAAACATVTASSKRWVIDPSTAAGKAGVAAVLQAHAMGKSINISGTGTCLIWADTETVAWVRVF